MTLEGFLLDILVCPETKEKLELAPRDVVKSLNEAIEKGKLKNRAGKPVREPLDEALLRADRAVAYPVRDDIPILLIDEAIEL
jgi:uncharacterized protein YbaR (Trm112 family)